MKARQIYEALRGLDTGWVTWDQTVDTFKAGDPESEVRGIAVGWMSYTWALKRALELGIPRARWQSGSRGALDPSASRPCS